MKIESRHYSGINFDWVVVREVRFVDNPAADDFVALRDLGADVQVDGRVDATMRVCRTMLRLTLTPSVAEPDRFQVITAAIEGQFSVAAGATPSVELATFAKKQAAAILMPFLREALADATAKSRFGQVLVPPINVIALMAAIEKEEMEPRLP